MLEYKSLTDIVCVLSDNTIQQMQKIVTVEAPGIIVSRSILFEVKVFLVIRVIDVYCWFI